MIASRRIRIGSSTRRVYVRDPVRSLVLPGWWKSGLRMLSGGDEVVVMALEAPSEAEATERALACLENAMPSEIADRLLLKKTITPTGAVHQNYHYQPHRAYLRQCYEDALEAEWVT